MKVNTECKFYKLTGIEAILGSLPPSPEVYSEYLRKKVPEDRQAEVDAEIELMEQNAADKIDNKMTVFQPDNHGRLCIKDYVIKGFFKAALTTLKDQLSVKAAKSKIDNLVFISPTYIQFRSGEDYYTKEDYICERPLRAETMQGPRVALAASQALDPGWEIYFRVDIVENYATKASKDISFDILETALDYGRFKGLGQWRNAGNGRFEWEEITEEEFKKVYGGAKK